MNISVDGLKLLETVSAGRGVCVDASKVPPYESEKKRERMLRLLHENAPEGVFQAAYWLDGKTGGVRSRPNIFTLSHAMFVASKGHVLVEVNVGVETLCCLRSSGPDGNDLADRVCAKAEVSGRSPGINLWDYITTELATEEEKAADPPRIAGGPPKALRNHFKVQFFRASYGMQPSSKWGETEEEVAQQNGYLRRLLARWPGLWLTGTKEERQVVQRRRRLQSAGVWLAIALEAERQGCDVVGFWMDEPIIECPVGMDAAGVKHHLEDRVYEMFRQDYTEAV